MLGFHLNTFYLKSSGFFSPLFPWVFSVHRAQSEAFACLVSANEMLRDTVSPCLEFRCHLICAGN